MIRRFNTIFLQNIADGIIEAMKHNIASNGPKFEFDTLLSFGMQLDWYAQFIFNIELE